uniref:DUF7041 domain-containing protein n=1 Tax=Pectinophora gossypiella TaxID=13191 RepID=A0A1E1W488_PECGO
MSEPRRSADTDAAGGSADGRFFECEQRTSGEVNRVGVRVPPFYPQKPSLWFAQLESQFVLANITTESTKFHYTLGSLDPLYAAEVEDIVADPDMTNKYTRLKTELIKRLSASREKKVMQLLTREELGDRKPSQFLRHLKQLAGPEVPEGFMRTIWASRLPTSVQSIIASQVKKPLDEVAELADTIIDVVQPTPQVASTSRASTSDDSSTSMSGQIAELTRLVCSLQTKVDRLSRPSDRSSSRSRNRRRSSSTRSQSNYRKHPVCFYHSKYGPKAHRCVKPCDYAGNDRGSR